MTTQLTQVSRFPGEGLCLLLARAERAMPRPLYLKLTQLMGPRLAASVVKNTRPKALPFIMRDLGPEFGASLAPHLPDESLNALVAESTPLATAVGICHWLARREDYGTLARFATQMPSPRIKAFIVAFNNVDAIAHTAQYLTPDTLKRFAHAFSDSYVGQLGEALDRLGYHAVEAELGRVMAPDYLIALLQLMNTDQIVRFLRDAPPTQVGHVLVKFPAERRNSIGQALMDAKYHRR